MRTPAAAAVTTLILAAPAAAQYDDPGVFITPATGTYTERTQSVRITWTHEYDLVSTSHAIKLNGNPVPGFTYEPQTIGNVDGSGVSAVSTGTVTLADGANTLSGYICGVGSGCTTEEVVLTYEPPPPPAQRASPAVSTVPHHSGYADPLRFGSTLSYTTPSYLSLDQERAVTLYYSSELANPKPFIQFDVTDPSLEPAARYQVQVFNGGTALKLSHGWSVAYFSSQGAAGAPSRLAVELHPTALPATGAYNLTLQVRSIWSGGTQPAATTRPIRVLVVNRGTSPFGGGWGVYGLQRIHVQPDGLLVDEGDGSARFFAGAGPSYASPEGDFSTLTRTAGSTYQRTWPDGAGAGYDAMGKLLYVYSAAGDTTRYEYTSDRLDRIVDPAGQAAVFDYASSSLAGITVPGGRRTQFSQVSGDLAEIIEPDGTRAVQQISYSTGHRLSSWVDRAGGAWNLAYSPSRVVTVTAPQILVNGTQTHRPVTTIASEKRLLVALGDLGTSAMPLPRVPVDSAYTSVTDPRGFATRAWLDRFGLPTKVLGPLGHLSTTERNQHGQPVRISGNSGSAVNLDWNPNGKLARSFDESRGLQTDYGYQTMNGSTFLSRSSEGHANVEYDRGSRGEILSVRVGTDTVARYTYDARLRVKTATDRGNHTTEYFYDGNAWKNADSVRSVTSAGVQRSAVSYDEHGRTGSVTDPAGRVTTYSYDLLNRLLKERAPGDSVTYVPSARGLYQVRDAAGKVYTFNRNLLGWVESEADAQGRTTSYRYDAGGYVTGSTDRLGRAFAMRYDAVGRLDSLAAPDVGTIRYGFHNPGGNWITAERVGESADTLHIDGAGRVTTAISWMGGVRYQVQSGYHANGQRSRVEVAAGVSQMQPLLWQEVVQYGYDSRQRLSSLTDATGFAAAVQYDAEWLPGTITYPQSTASVTLGHTPRHGIGSVQYNRPALNTAFGANPVGYDGLDRLQSRATQDGKRLTQYGYDALGRLSARTEDKLTWVPPPGFCQGNSTEPVCDGYWDWRTVRSENFVYDAVGNRTGWTYGDSTGAWLGHSPTLQPASNRYETYAGWTLVYDSIGNLVRRYNGAQDVQYQWNSLGQLTGVYTPATGWVQYGYNGFGRRVRRTAGGVTTRYVYDGDDLAAEVDASGNRIRTYAFWPGIDQPHSMRTWENGANGALHYYALELPSNNVIGLFNTAGTATHAYHYSPYGEAQSSSEPTHNPLRFAARELDAQTGLYYVRARWYDPFMGRFMSEDPIGLEGGINQYAYALNDPVNLSDPTGLIPCTKYWIVMGGFVNMATLVISGGCDANDPNAGRNSELAERGRGSSIFGSGMVLGGSWNEDGSGPLWPLAFEERERLECVAVAWLSAEAQALHAGVQYMTADLARLLGDPYAQAVTLSPTLVVFAAGPNGPLRNHGPRMLGLIVGHELGHVDQYRLLGIDGFRQLWGSSDAARDRLQRDADAFADRHVRESGPVCPIGPSQN